MPSSKLFELIYQTVEALPGTSIDNAAEVLETCAAGVGLRASVLNSVALPHERLLLSLLLDHWTATAVDVSPSAMAAALRSASYTRTKVLKDTQAELVWTGPSHGISARRTDQALLQVIQSAEKELLLVTFAAYKVPLIVDALKATLERGVRVRFVAESAEESAGKVSYDAANALGSIAERLQIFIWPRSKRAVDQGGNFGSLHAKCALADRHALLISSANLTDHALALNIEMGVLIHGGLIPHQVYSHFERLMNIQELVVL